MAHKIIKLPVADATSDELHIYADGTSGSDSNDGYDAARPKKTLQAVLDLIPIIIRHNIGVHLTGDFTMAADARMSARYFSTMNTGAAPVLVIDGGSALTTVADNAGSPWVADIHSSSSLGLSTLGWTIDQYVGYYIEVVSGPCAGQTRTIQGNTATTITPNRNWSGDPGLAQFRISRPTTTIRNKVLYFGDIDGYGYFAIQRLYFDGNMYPNFGGFGRSMCAYVSSIVSNQHQYGYAAGVTSPGGVMFTNFWYDPTTFAQQVANTTAQCGAGFLSTDLIDIYGGVVSVNSLVTKGSVAISCADGLMVWYGSRIMRGLSIKECRAYTPMPWDIANTGGYATTKISNSAGIGLLLENSRLRVASGDFSNSTSHAIAARRSMLELTGAVAGSGNAGAGVYAYDNSLVTTKIGSIPTITGTVGNLAVSSAAVQETTWADINAGTVVSVDSEQTLVKAV
jgi:hypothetical protein